MDESERREGLAGPGSSGQLQADHISSGEQPIQQQLPPSSVEARHSMERERKRERERERERERDSAREERASGRGAHEARALTISLVLDPFL
jgi:hypothetical protein